MLVMLVMLMLYDALFLRAGSEFKMFLITGAKV